jgi:hypothetical protein
MVLACYNTKEHPHEEEVIDDRVFFVHNMVLSDQEQEIMY